MNPLWLRSESVLPSLCLRYASVQALAKWLIHRDKSLSLTDAERRFGIKKDKIDVKRMKNK